MALKLNGKDDRLTRQDFLALARTIGLTLRDAETAMNEIPTGSRSAPGHCACPRPPVSPKRRGAFQDKVIALIEERCAGLGGPAE